MPSEWYSAASSPDTYSNDGSYGLNPGDYGNFPGIMAHGGLRWVAGASVGPESIGQILTSPLMAGAAYSMSAYLQQAIRGDLNNPGGYDVRFESADRSLGFDAGILGYTTTVAAGWTLEVMNFTAPANATSLTRIVFVPVSPAAGGGSYSGLDDVTLQAVPEPAASLPLGLGALALLRRRRK